MPQPALRMGFRPRKSLTIWVLLALLATVFAYVLTIALAVASVVVPCMLLAKSGSFIVMFLPMLALGAFLAGTMLWSIMPRRERFKEMGPKLTPEGQPRLFAEIERIALALGQPVPATVYLVVDVNAWVAQRGGFLGIGGKRVLGLGLPLLPILTISQFRAVLAHEFGHYYSGDTRLGPWMFRARAAMTRTLTKIAGDPEMIRGLGRFGPAGLAYLLVVIVVHSYWKLFARLTQMISHRQEFRADELACAVAGSNALAAGLQRMVASGQAQQPFWRSQILPALQAGFQLPIAEGFAQYLAVPTVAVNTIKHLHGEIRRREVRANDTHPPLADRLKAIADRPVAPLPEQNEPALTLLDDVEALELELLRILVPQMKGTELKKVKWSDLGPALYLPSWRSFVAANARALAGMKFSDIPRLNMAPQLIAAQIADPKGQLLTRSQRTQRARWLVWNAFALVLLDHGWQISITPAECLVRNGEHSIRLQELDHLISTGKLDPSEWEQRLRLWQVPDLDLLPQPQAS